MIPTSSIRKTVLENFENNCYSISFVNRSGGLITESQAIVIRIPRQRGFNN